MNSQISATAAGAKKGFDGNGGKKQPTSAPAASLKRVSQVVNISFPRKIVRYCLFPI